jgi:hypothetical protein
MDHLVALFKGKTFCRIGGTIWGLFIGVTER